MKFDFDGASYLVEFERSNRVPEGSVAGVPRTYTTARILKVTGPEKTDREVVRSYTVGCSHRDRFTLEGGRKYALTLAMYDAPTQNGQPSLLGSGLSKEFRTAAWTAYHKRPGGLLG